MKPQQNNYAFIDSQNLHLSIRRSGWKLDFQRFNRYLYDNYHVTKLYLFLGYVPDNKYLYTTLRQMGYTLVFKPTVEKSGVVKGNCDAELVLHCMIEYNNFDKAVIVTGDGDFHCLIEHLDKQEKLLKIGIPDKYKYSALLRKFRDRYFFYVSDLKRKLEYNK